MAGQNDLPARARKAAALHRKSSGVAFYCARLKRTLSLSGYSFRDDASENRRRWDRLTAGRVPDGM